MKPGGVMVVNTKDRIENGRVVRLDQRVKSQIEDSGFKLVEHKRVHARPGGHRVVYERYHPDVPHIRHEDFMVFKRA